MKKNNKSMKKNKLFLIIALINIFLFFNFVKNQVVAQSSCPNSTTYSDTQATLVGEIRDTGGDPNINAWFEWGTSSYLSNFTPIQFLNVSNPPQRFCHTLTNLQPCTTYYYRAVVRNSVGAYYGQIYSFRTSCYTSDFNVSCTAQPNPANVNQTVTFRANVSGGTGSYSYVWSGACSDNSATCLRSFSQPGTYVANVVVTSGNQTKSASCSVVVNQISYQETYINKKPIAIISFSPERIFPGTIVTFDASRSYDPDGYITFYEWRVNDKIASFDRVFYRALASGNYRIKLTVIDNRGAIDSEEVVINVGRTVFKKETKIITKKVPTFLGPEKLVDIFLKPIYTVYFCKKNEIEITVINNTYVNRKVTLVVYGESERWFNPSSKTLILKPKSTNLIRWEVIPDCKIKEGVYRFGINLKTPGASYDYEGNLEVKSKSNLFSSFLGLLGLLLLLLILLILIIAIILYLIFRKRE